MFRIGDFARIGRVSGRQLRYYDELGLLSPAHTDAATGYRYYSVRQLPRLNRILALKALGFSLDQIGALLDGALAPDELRGMLTLKRAQVEQTLADEQTRLRQIEARIRQIEEQGAIADYDVALRAVPAQPFLSVRRQFSGMPEAFAAVQSIAALAIRAIRPQERDALTIVAHTDFEDETLDLEIGFTLTSRRNAPLALANGVTLTPRELEPVETMASLVRSGPPDEAHQAYGALGIWMEANGYVIDGLCREVFLEVFLEAPTPPPAAAPPVIEIQFPVTHTA